MGVPKAQIITKNGKKEFAIIPYADFLRMREDLEDYEDLRCLREAKKSEKKAPTVSLSALKRSLARRTNRPRRRVRAHR
jgi:PHD/YefM family antitoxin component YafN of YafNO toxin-antitoxin module